SCDESDAAVLSCGDADSMPDCNPSRDPELSHKDHAKPVSESDYENHSVPTSRAVADAELVPGEFTYEHPPACSTDKSLRPTTFDLDGTPCAQTSAEVFEPAHSNGSGLRIQSEISRIDARSAAIRGVLDRLSEKTAATLQEKLNSLGAA